MRAGTFSAAPATLAIVASIALPARADDTLTLEQAVELARRQHPTVDAQRAQAAAAQARTEQSVSGLFPSLTGSLAYQPQTANYAPAPPVARTIARGDVTVVDTRGQPESVSCLTPGVGNCVLTPLPPVSYALHSYWIATAGVTWTPWDWGRSIYAYRSARSAAESADVGVVTAQRNVVLEVKLAFFAAVAAQQQLAVGEESVVTFAKELEQTRAFQREGLRTGIDVATAESGLASAQLTLARARAGLESARARFSLALGEDTWHAWRLALDPSVFDLQAGDELQTRAAAPALVDLALRQRSEPRQLELLERSFRQLGSSQRGRYLPQLDLSLAPNWTGPELSGLTPNLVLTVALGFPLGGMSPLFVHGQVREAEANLRATLAQERAARDGIREETMNAQALLAAAREGLLAARKLAAAAGARRQLAVGRYATGIGNIIELQEALLDDVNARFQLVQAGYDLASARTQLQHALGQD